MLLYIHIPFCDSKCFYCSFNSYTDKFHLKQEYMNSLCIQLKNDLEQNLSENQKIDTVFIGGGTPSSVKAQNYEKVFELIKPHLKKGAEVTTEANPNSATKEWLETMKSFGVNRVSFGVQSFDDEKLKKLGRSHNSKRALKAIQEANCIGFNSINCDIIYGVEGDTYESIKKDLDIVSSLPVKHLSAYSLTIEEGTKFFNNKKIKIDDEDLSQKIFSYLEKIGFNQYEISNFSKSKENESKHNFGYWSYDNYLGVGAGAVACINDTRYYPITSIKEYIKDPLANYSEKLDSEDIKTEKVLLGLRCSYGVYLNILNEKELKKVEELTKENKLKIKENKFFNKDFLLADEIALYILD